MRNIILAGALMLSTGCAQFTNTNGLKSSECSVQKGTVVSVNNLGYTVQLHTGAQYSILDSEHGFQAEQPVWVLGYADNRMLTELLCGTEFKVLARNSSD